MNAAATPTLLVMIKWCDNLHDCGAVLCVNIMEGIVQGDGFELIKEVEDEAVDLILSDIPYGISHTDWDVLHDNTNSALLGSSPAQKGKAVFKSRGKPINGWSAADREIPRQYYDWCSRFAGDWLRVLKPGGSCIVFAGRRYNHRCTTALEDAGFNFRDMLFWDRTRAPHRAQRLSIVFERRGLQAEAEHWEGWRLGNLRPLVEPIIWCFKPYAHTIADNVLQYGLGAYNQDAITQYGGVDNILHVGFASNEGSLHTTQKPLKLMEALIELTTRKDHLVLDPFCGSGTTAVAARTLGRRHLAFEQDPKYVKKAKSRIAKATPRMFW